MPLTRAFAACFRLASLLALLLLVSTPIAAADLRGLKVVALDTTSKQSEEVPLYDKSYALIIGIDDYKYLPPDRQLKQAVRDAQGVEATIKRLYKFDKIVTLYNQQATRANILDTLTADLPRDMGENDALFVFWAGHGNQESSRTGDIGYLIPYDGNPAKLRTNITMTELRDTVSKVLPAKHVFYVMDACYGGLLTETRSIDKKPRRDLAYLKEITREPVRQVLTAGGKGQEVLDGGPNGHSVFTGRLIEVLEQAGDFVTANELQAILKERVYTDARARNHSQTPAYGTLYGSGDFVFVPSLERKVEDNRSQIAKLEAELKALDAADARAKAARTARERQRLQDEADAKRRAAEARLKMEQIKQQQLVEEEKRREAEEADRQRLLAARTEDERRLAELKAAAEARRKNAAPDNASDFPTIESAIAEIRRLNQRIEDIEAGYRKDLAGTKQKIQQRYAGQLAALEVEEKDEFETRAAFQLRIGQRRNELTRQREAELANLNLQALAEAETSPLKARIQSLSEREYRLGAEYILVDLGRYDAEKGVFPVSLRNRPAGKNVPTPALKVAFNGSLPLQPAEARQFKQHWSAGLVRAEVIATPEAGTKVVQLVNDADGSRRASYGEEFMTSKERQERQERQYRPEMVAIPAGSLDMGSHDGDSDEEPVHRVNVPAFAMSKTEVTQGQWRAVMGGNPSHFKACGDDCPVENVSWNDVQAFIRRLNALTGQRYRLPSEAEWEYAARAGTTTKYPWGDEIGRDNANCEGCGGQWDGR